MTTRAEKAAEVERACGLKLKQELRKAKREKREMWKAMSVNCTYQDMYADCTAQDGHPECTISNCPLLLKRGKGKG